MQITLQIFVAVCLLVKTFSFDWKDEVTLSIMEMLKQFLSTDEVTESQQRIQILNDLVTIKNYMIDNVDQEEVGQEHLELLPSAFSKVANQNADGRRLQFNFPSARGLDDQCSNKLCKYIEKQFACKSIGIDLDKICARYLLGTIYGCTDFPHGYQKIYSAPSSCLDSYIGLISTLASAAGGSTSALMANFKEYLFVDFDNNACGRECYQKFQTKSNDFFLSCQKQLNASAKHYPVISILSNFQQFRNNACGRNTVDYNCYTFVTSLLESTTPGPNIFDFKCNYYGVDAVNAQVLQGLCGKFSALGCCAGSAIELITQNQLNVSNLSIFPPCLLRYFRNDCPTVNLNQLCYNGSIASQTIFQGNFYLPRTALHYLNVYDKTNMTFAQGVLSYIVQSLGYYDQPWYVSKDYPFKVKIIDYVYYNATGYPLTPHTNIPTTFDYDNSVGGNYTYQFTLMNLDSDQAAQFAATLSSTAFYQYIMGAFGTYTAKTYTATTTTFDSNPLSVDNGNDGDKRKLSSGQITVILVFMALFIFGIIIAFNNNLYGKLFPKKQPTASTA